MSAKKLPPKVTPATKKKEARKKLKLERESKRSAGEGKTEPKWGGWREKMSKAMNWSTSSSSSSSETTPVEERNAKRKPGIVVEDLDLGDSTDTSGGINKQTDKRKRLRKQQPSGDNEVRGIKRYSHG